jgi:hypothetical protein
MRSGFRQWNFEFLVTLKNLEKQVIWQHQQQGLILMSLKLGGLHEKHVVATWRLGTISAL